MYTSLSTKIRTPRLQPENPSLTLMAVKGEDIRDLPQLLSPENALLISNYLVTTNGGLAMRQGISQLFSDGTSAFTMLEKFNDNFYMYGTATKLNVYDKTLGTSTTIKTFSSSGSVQGARYGDYFFATNGTEALGRVSRTITYGTQTGNYTVGLKVTGGTSGATGIILEDSDSGATGTLTLGSVVGTFQNGEIITDTAGGSATSTSLLTWTYTTISGAPTGAIVEAIGTRLYVGRLKADPAAVAYSNADTGTNPPFGTWTVGALANDPGQLSFRNAGSVNAIESLGPNIIVFADNGKWSFYTNVIDSSGTLKKVDVITIARVDLGGTAAISTPKGLFYVNKAGLWQLISVGQPNVPFSDQEDLASRLLSSTYFDNITLTNASFAYDAKRETLLLTCANNASANNYVITYSTVFKAFTRFVGWNINVFLNDNQTIYGAGSTTGKVWKCFDGFQDDGNEIWTEFLQELKTGDLETRQALTGAYVQGFLSPSTSINIAFDIYDTTGVLVENKASYTWTAQTGTQSISEYGSASWGTSAWGGDVDTYNMIECFDGGRLRINNYQRIRVHLTAHGMIPHIINWIKLEARSKRQIRRRKLTIN